MIKLLRYACSWGLLLWVLFVYGAWLDLLPRKWGQLGPVLTPVVVFAVPIGLVFLIGLTNRATAQTPFKPPMNNTVPVPSPVPTSPVRSAPDYRRWLRTVGGGLAAILTWITAVAFVRWYQTPSGYLAYWAVGLSATLILEILIVIAPSAGKKLLGPIATGTTAIFENYEANMDWVAWFYLLCFYGAIVYFILMAPYGLLCHLNLRPCGQ